MKVAICFYGQPRKYKEVLSQWEVLISELNADVFIHTWHGQDRGKNQIDVNELIKDFNPKEIKVSNPHKFIELIPTDFIYENKSYHAINQSYSISNCFKIMNNYSNSFNIQYNLIIKCRMDINLHNIINVIEFIKSQNKNNNLYVAGNHWQHHMEFDDNIMIGNKELMNQISLNFFDYTIDIIKKTKLIPGGEQNIFRYVIQNQLLSNIVKNENLNFTLLTYSKGEELILNQNEIK
jgi:hypothetical protein